MANPLWKVGGPSPNPEGARRHSVRSPRGMVTAFITKHVRPKQFKALYDRLTAQEQMNVLLRLFPYVMTPQSADDLTPEMIDEIYNKARQIAENASKKAS